MRTSIVAGLITASAVIGLACAHREASIAQDPIPIALAPAAKIDPAVQATIDSGKPAPVIILGHQLLSRPDGFARFTVAHTNDDRRALRPRVIAELKRVAAREQPKILASLGKTKAERSLWIANAIVLTLTPDEIRKAAALPTVEFIYPSIEQFADQEPVGKLSAVLPREKSNAAVRSPHTARRQGEMLGSLTPKRRSTNRMIEVWSSVSEQT